MLGSFKEAGAFERFGLFADEGEIDFRGLIFFFLFGVLFPDPLFADTKIALAGEEFLDARSLPVKLEVLVML